MSNSASNASILKFKKFKSKVLNGPPEQRHYSRGEMIIQEEQFQEECFILQRGIVKSYFTEIDDSTTMQGVFGSGELLGDCEFISEAPSSGSFVAVTDVDVFVFSPGLLRFMLKSDKEFHKYVTETIDKNLSDLSENHSKYGEKLKEKLAKLLKIQSDQSIELCEEEMASCLEVTREKLDETLTELNKTDR